MKHIDILRELFDEKIVKILGIFSDNQGKHLSLSEISEKSDVNVATTFRIVNKLVKKGYVRTILIGKSKFYQLKNNEKTLTLFGMVNKDEDKVSEFINKIKEFPNINKVILESKDNKSAKLILIGNLHSDKKIKEIANNIENKTGYKIKYAEMNEKQFKEINNLEIYNLNEKVVWERK